MPGPFGKLSSRLRRVLSSVLAGIGFASSSFHDGCYANRNVSYKFGEDSILRKYEYNRNQKLENRRRRVKERKDSGVCSKILHKIKNNKILTTVEVGSLIGAGIFIKKTFFGSNDVYDVSKSIIKKCLKSGKTLGPDEWYDKLVEKDKRVKNVEEYNDLVKKSREKIDAESSEQIEKDLDRSGVPGEFRDFLKDMLISCCVQKKVRYWQGFNIVAELVINKFTGGYSRTSLSDEEKLKANSVFEVISEVYCKYMARISWESRSDFMIRTSKRMLGKFVSDNNLQMNIGSMFVDTNEMDGFCSIMHSQCSVTEFLSSYGRNAFWDYLISTMPEDGKFDVDRVFKETFNLYLALVFRTLELAPRFDMWGVESIYDALFFVNKNKEDELKLSEIT